MIHHKNNLRLVRLPDAFLPAALAAASALRREGNIALELYVAWLAVACLSLFASRGIRIAFARQPAIRHVRGSVKSALLMTLAGGALSAGALLAFLPALRPYWLPLILSGMLLNIEHIFYEYMYAIGDRRSASLSRGLTALFTASGLLMSSGTAGPQSLWLVGMTALSALVALVISLVMGDGVKGRPDWTPARCAPLAALQTALYPAAALALGALIRVDPVGLPFFAGLALYELCKTPFRRSPMEAAPFNRALLIVCCAAGLVCLAAAKLPLAASGAQSLPGFLLKTLPAACAMIILAAICAFALFGNLDKRDE